MVRVGGSGEDGSPERVKVGLLCRRSLTERFVQEVGLACRLAWIEPRGGLLAARSVHCCGVHFGLVHFGPVPNNACTGTVTCRRFARAALLGAWLAGSNFRLGVGTLSRTGCGSFESALEMSMSTVGTTLVNLASRGSNLAVVFTASTMPEQAARQSALCSQLALWRTDSSLAHLSE